MTNKLHIYLDINILHRYNKIGKWWFRNAANNGNI